MGSNTHRGEAAICRGLKYVQLNVNVWIICSGENHKCMVLYFVQICARVHLVAAVHFIQADGMSKHGLSTYRAHIGGGQRYHL